jgi:small subunit ribosomal protein S5
MENFEQEWQDRTIFVNKVTKVVKGGKNIRFSALVVVGDRKGRVGFGKGKSREVPLAVKKAVEKAKKNVKEIPLTNTTIPHEVVGCFKSSKVILKPALPGTGVIAGGTVRAVLETLGVSDILTKVIGSTNHYNLVRATMNGLLKLRSPDKIKALRGIEEMEEEK